MLSRACAAIAVFAHAGTAWAGPPGRDDLDFFEARVRPVLVKRCYGCHSQAAGKSKGGLQLDLRASVLRGGLSGPVVVAGAPDKSPLVLAVRRGDPDLEMPPDEPLPADEIAALEEWVARGLPDPRDAIETPARTSQPAAKLWSLQPISAPTGRTVDAFIESALREKGLRPVGPADRRTLLRRATFDLTGLPPTPAEIRAFVNDAAPGAFARVVDRLLASPHYGEHWGRHWLDLVRYADTAGCSSDFPVPQAVMYRDYVIRAFNTDKPYDAFLREQIAGDLLPAVEEETKEERFGHIVATGYLALSRRFGIKQEEAQHLTIEDSIENLGRTVLGLGLGCARCHDHKFDPVSQEDYYGLYGIFASTRYPFTGSEERKFQEDFVPLASSVEIGRVVQPFLAKLKTLDSAIDHMDERANAAGAGLEAKPMLETVARMRKERLAFVVAEGPPVPMAYAVSDGAPIDAHVHVKGDPQKLGREVARRTLAVLGGRTLTADEARGSGRLQLARFLTRPENPLLTRVMANRIWQYHFGRGLVATPNDFGVRGSPPSHPELLDELAGRFIASGFSVKAMHRLIMLSDAYQRGMRSDAASTASTAVDPDNRLLWKWSPRRLEAEAVRDSLLAASGELERSPGGGHPFPAVKDWDYSQARPFSPPFEDFESNRRTVYLMSQRLRKRPFLELFQGADPNLSTPVRIDATTPLQALYLMNSPDVFARSRAFADRVRRSHASQRDRIDLAYTLVLARPPRAAEARAAAGYLKAIQDRLAARGLTGRDEREREAWASFARTLFAANEFIFVE